MKKYAEVSLDDLAPIAIVLVVTVIIVAFGAQVTSDVGSDFTADSTEANITTAGLEGLTNLSGKMGTIGLIAAIAVVLGLVGAFMAYRARS